jgi:hypothetical protein
MTKARPRAGPSGDAAAAVEALEHGDWRAGRALAAARLHDVDGLRAVAMLAGSMRLRCLGEVEQSWLHLARMDAATAPRPHAPLRPRLDGDGDRLLPALFGEASPNAFVNRVRDVGRREATAAAEQVRKLRNHEHSKRAALVEACADHLTWVEFDPWTWRLAARGDRGEAGAAPRIGDRAGRDYFLRRATRIQQWVSPRRGSVSRRVWDALGGYRAVRAEAFLRILELEAARPCRRRGLQAARDFAMLWSNSVPEARMRREQANFHPNQSGSGAADPKLAGSAYE